MVANAMPCQMRSVTFRFCDIADAVKFKQTLSRAEEWEECNVHFAPDPSVLRLPTVIETQHANHRLHRCAEATGIHFD